MTTKEQLKQMYKDLLINCMNMSLNVCDECPSKKECCKIAFERYNSYNIV
jgi:hypothetical protein